MHWVNRLWFTLALGFTIWDTLITAAQPEGAYLLPVWAALALIWGASFMSLKIHRIKGDR